MADIITPNWLRVERAMIFFRSHSTIAAIPAIHMVRQALSKIVKLKRFNCDRNG